MAEAKLSVRIFLSSPGDVVPERERAEAVIAALSAELEARGELALEAVRWEDSWFTAAAHFQEQIVRPSQCELVVCLFWKRLGTELPTSFARTHGSRTTGTVWEFEEALEGARTSPDKVPDIFVYRKTAPVTYADATVDLERAQKRALDAFWDKWFQSEDGHFLAAFTPFATTDDFARIFRQHLERWLADRRGKGRWSIELQGSPFRGLTAFGEDHASVFFGRRRQVEQARARLIAAAERNGGLPFLLILGMSGAGKSSLLRAGLVPRLLTPDATPGITRWRRLVVTPAALGPDPLLGLAQCLLREDALPELTDGDFGQPDALAQLLREAPGRAAQPIARALDRWGGRLAAEAGHGAPPGTGLLLGLDQLEEIFAWPAGLRGEVLNALRALLDSGRLWVVATLRSDFYPLLQAEAQLLAMKEAGRSLDLAAPEESQLAEIIEAPAAAAGLSYETDAASHESLAEKLLADARGGANTLPLLQFALQELFESRDQEGLLRVSAYEAMGGLPGAIEQRAEATVAALPAEVQAALPEVIGSLADPAEEAGEGQPEVARRVPLARFGEASPARRLADALVQARLLTASEREGQAEVRVAHEALFSHWAKARALLEASREARRLRRLIERQAKAWRDGGGNRDDLLRGSRLLQAKELIGREGESSGLDEAAIAFVQSSARTWRKEQRDRRLIALVAAAGVLLAIIAGVGAYYGFTGRAEAERQTAIADQQRKVAEQQSQRALQATQQAQMEQYMAQKAWREAEAFVQQLRRYQARTLVLESLRQTEDGNALLGMLLALEVWNQPTDAGEAPPLLDEAEAALKAAVYTQGSLATLSAGYDSVRSVAVSADGSSLLTASEDRMAHVWDLRAGVQRLSLKGHTGTVVAVAFSPDMRLLATGSEDGTARLWDGLSGDQLFVLQGREGTVWEVQFSRDGARLLSYAQDNVQRVWNTATGAELAVFAQHTEEIMHASFSPDGSRVASASLDGFADIWDAATGQLIAQVGGDYTGGIEWVEWDAAGERIITADRDNAAEVWNAADGQFLFGLYGRHGNWVTRATFSPDGNHIATGDFDGKVHLWNGQNGDHLFLLDGHGCVDGSDGTSRCVIWETAFSPDGRYLATLGRDATVRIWDVASYETLDVMDHGGATISDIDFTPNSSTLITSSWDGTARLWDVSGGAAKAVLGRRSLWITEAAFSPDGSELAIGSGNEGILMRFGTADGKQIGVLPYHINEITHLEYSADGKRLLSSAFDYTAAVWKLDAMETENEEPYAMGATFHDREVLDADFSPDASLYVTASIDGTSQIVETETGELRFTLTGHDDRINTARFDPTGTRVVTAGDDGFAFVWDATTGQVLHRLHLHRTWVNHAEFSADGSKVLTASSDGQLGLWDASSGTLIRALRAFERNAWHASGNREGTRIAAAGQDGGVLFDATTGLEVARLPHDYETYSAFFSPDGQLVLTYDEGGRGAVWSAADGALTAELLGHSAPIYFGTWSEDGSTIATVSEDGTAILWDPATGEATLTIENPRDEYWDVSFSPDGRWVIGGGFVNLGVWDVETGDRMQLLTGSREHIVRAIFSPDGARLISASLDGTAILRDADTFEAVSTISHYNPVYDVGFSADSARLVTVDQEGQVAVWDGKTADLISLLEGHSDRVNSAHFDPADSTRLVTASDDHRAIVWNATRGEALLTLAGHTRWVNEAIYSPDGSKIATVSADGTARLWDSQTGALLKVFVGHNQELWDGAFSPDGDLLVTVSTDKTARVWDVATGTERFVLSSKQAGVNRVAFSPIGDHIATVSDDRKVRIWDTATGILVTTLEGHTDSIVDVEFSPDGRELVTGGLDGRVRLWRVPSGADLLTAAKERAGRELTHAERVRFGMAE